jgi:GntR family transcriptional repressor for pyruvate dehydrogenase complex
METVTAALYARRRHSVSGAIDLKESAELHREIYRAIRAGKPELARETMEKHLNLARLAQASEGLSSDGTGIELSDPPRSTRVRAERMPSERRKPAAAAAKTNATAISI